MTVISAFELSLLRSQPHRTKLHLFIPQFRTMLAALLNNPTATKGDTTIPFDNVSSGLYTKVIAGMTLYVGTSLGGGELGRVRVKAITSTQITVAENDDIQWADNTYLTITSFMEPWAMYPQIILNAANVPTFYKDTDIPYTNQNSVFDPIVLMGPNLPIKMDRALGYGGRYFDGSLAYDLNTGGTIVSWLWTWEKSDGTIETSTLATPGYKYWYQPGDYNITLTVINSLGNSFTGYRVISVRTDYGGTNPPIKRWGIDSLSGDYSASGWSGSFWMRQDAGAQIVRPGALIMILAEDWYGGVKRSIGGNYPNREDLVFVGYVRDGSVEIDPTTNIVRFDAVSITIKLDISEVFSVSVVSSSTPTTWYQLKNMTVDRAIYHFIRWHTTIYHIADVRQNGNTLPVQNADFSREPIRSAINNFLSSTLMGNFVSDRQGQIWTEKDVDIVEIGDRILGTTLALVRKDWLNSLKITQVRDAPASYVELGGIQYDGPTAGTFTAILSSAPGLSPKYTGKTQIINGMVLENQTKTNQLVGNILAKLNNEFPSVEVQLAGDYRIFDIAPQQRITSNLQPSENDLKLWWRNKAFIPRSISFAYSAEAQVLMTQIAMEAETDGPPGVTGPYPITPPDDPIDFVTDPLDPPTPPDPPIPTPPVAGDGNTVFGLRDTFIVRTYDFLNATPTWEDVTGIVTGTPIIFRLDPYDPSHKAIVLTTTGIWYSLNIRDSVPIWVQSISTADMQALTAASLMFSTMSKLVMDITVDGKVHVLVVNFVTNLAYYLKTSDYTTGSGGWSSSNMGTARTDGGQPQSGFAVSQHNSNHIYASINLTAGDLPILRYSLNGGASWSSITVNTAGFSSGHNSPAFVFLPYTGNDSDQIIYIYGAAPKPNLAATLDGGATWFDVANAGIVTYANQGIQNEEAVTESPIGSAGTTVYWIGISNPGGGGNGARILNINVIANTYSQIFYTANVYDNRGWGFGGWPYDVNILRAYFKAAASVGALDDKVVRSIDGGVTFVSAHGNLDSVSTPGTVVTYLVPVWTV